MEEVGEVEMKDAADDDRKAGKWDKEMREGKDEADMEVDGVD